MGDGGNGGLGGIFDPLLGYLTAVVDAIIAFLNALVAAIVSVVNFLWAGEQALFGFSLLGDSAILKWLRGVFASIFQAGVLKALGHLYALYQKLHAWLQKLKTWLDRLHALQQKYMVQSLRRIFNIIQRVRKILVIFRLFHLKFAAKLDAWLAGVEGKIASHVFLIGRKTNTIIAWLNWVCDPIGTLRKNVLVVSLLSAIDDLCIGLTGQSWAALFGIGKQGAGAAGKSASMQHVMDAREQQIIDGTGDAGDMQQRAPALRAKLFAEMGLQDVGNG